MQEPQGGGAYRYDPETDRIIPDTSEPLPDEKPWNMLEAVKWLKAHQSDTNEPIDPIAA